MRSSFLSSAAHDDQPDDGSDFGGDDDDGGSLSIDLLELAAYARCVTTMWGYISARLPHLVAERDEETLIGDGERSGEDGNGGEEPACAELLVHLLSLSHRLAPLEADENGAVSNLDRLSGGGASEGAGGASVGASGGASAAGSTGAERFVWQVDLCPAALASSACAALRSAVTLICEQEMRAAMQTRRATAMAEAPPPGSAAKGGRKGGHSASRTMTKAAAESEWANDAWVQMVRLRRLRERLQRALPMHLQLLGAVAGGGGSVVHVWAQAVWVAVIEPLAALFSDAPTGSAVSIDVLGLCLEHRRIAVILRRTQRTVLRAEAVKRGGEAAMALATVGGLDGDGGVDGVGGAPLDGAPDDDLAAIDERVWYSPFVFQWLAQSTREVGEWLDMSLDDEEWQPPGGGRTRLATTNSLLHAYCLTLVRTLRRLFLHTRGEAVTVGQSIADHYARFARGLESAAVEELTDATSALPGARSVTLRKAAGAMSAIHLQNGDEATPTSKGGKHEVVVAGVDDNSPLAGMLAVGDRLLSVDGVAMDDAKQAAAALRPASRARLRVMAPPTRRGAEAADAVALRNHTRDVRAVRRLDETRALLTLLRLEKTIPLHDPLSVANGGGGADDAARLGDGGDALRPDAIEGGVSLGSDGDDDDGEGGIQAAINAVGTAVRLEDDTLRILLGEATAVGSSPADAGRGAVDGGDEGGMGSGVFVAADDDAEAARRALWWRCVLAGNAWAARRSLDELASALEGSLDGTDSTAEQRVIISEGFVPVFTRLRAIAEAHIHTLLNKLMQPLHAHVAALSPQLGARPLGGGRPDAPANLESLAASYTSGLRWLRRFLESDVFQRLLQRMWTALLTALTDALSQSLFVPAALGTPFAVGALALLVGLSHVLRADGDGPSPEWLRRRSAPLTSTLELCVEASTATLLQQCRIQPVGKHRAAPLVALSLRMDDGSAAELIAQSPPSELMGADAGGGAGAALLVDGQPALEAVRRGRDIREACSEVAQREMSGE